MAAIRQLVGIDKDQELLEAARHGKCEVIEKLLKKSTSGSSLLTNLSSFLKVNINCVDREKDTPLHLAALNDHVGAVEILLRENASVNVVDNRGCNPLHLAAWKGNVEICKILLTNPHSQVQVNLQNCDGETPLHSAAQYGFTPTVSILLEHHSDPTIRNLKDESPLDLAARYGRVEVVQLLIDKCPDLVHSPTFIHSPLHLAVACGHRQIVEILLDKGFNINTKTEDGTALHLAALYCKPDIVRILLDRGIDCTERDKDGKTVLEILQEQNNQASLEILSLITDHLNKNSQESLEAKVYETLVDHTPKPVPKPRPSVSSSPEPERKSPPMHRTSEASVQYARIDKSQTGKAPSSEDENAVFQKDAPPVPPRQSTFDGGDTSPVHSLPTQLQPGGYLAMSESPMQSPKPNRPVKPLRKKKGTSPLPKRSNTSESSPEKPESTPPYRTRLASDSEILKTGSDLTKPSIKSKDHDITSSTAAPAPCDNLKDSKKVEKVEKLNDEKVKNLEENKDRKVIQTNLDVNLDNSAAEENEPTTEYEVMSQVKQPNTQEQTDVDVHTKSSSLARMEVIDTYQIASGVTRKSSLERKDVIDTYQIASSVVGKGESLDRKDVIDTYQFAGEIAKFRDKDNLPPPCPAGIQEEGSEVRGSKAEGGNKSGKELSLIQEEAGTQYENNASVVTAREGSESERTVEEEGIQYENNASVSTVRESQGFTPMRDSKGFIPMRVSKGFETKTTGEVTKEEDNPYDATLFMQTGPKSENIPSAQSEPKTDIPKNESEPNKKAEEERKETSEAEYMNNCDRNCNIPKDSIEQDVIYEEPISRSKQKLDIPKKPTVGDKPIDKKSPAGTKVSPKGPKPPLVPKPSMRSDKHDKQKLVSASKQDNCDVPVCDNTGGEYVTISESVLHQAKEKSERLSNGVSDAAEGQGTKPPGSLELSRKKEVTGIPLTPTGYTQPPTPDFPPPSPHTALVGIEEKMAIIDNKRSSKDMETITEANMLTESQGHTADTENSTVPVTKATEAVEPVVMRRASARGSNSSMDDIVTDEKLGPFAGLYLRE
ncbi:uncharacterized protein DDB_G0284459-like [Saccostrea cucullata]|uniref:uncharacterized protein DDB_G0284459-like n=1 Tax=Saccostrea cuccullata TaxID=36930 RepID=UPI002ED5AAB4